MKFQTAEWRNLILHVNTTHLARQSPVLALNSFVMAIGDGKRALLYDAEADRGVGRGLSRVVEQRAIEHRLPGHSHP